MHLLNNLHKTLLWSMVTVAFLSVGLVAALSIVQEYRRFEVESRDLKEEYLAQQKALVKQEVDRVVDYIEYQRSTTEHSLKKELQAQVERGHAIADNIYNRYQQSKSEEEIKGLIREALRPVRFYDNRGYYFIYDMQGNNVLLPFSPQLEGKNLWDLQDSKGEYTIRRMVEMVREQGEGFLDWYWYKPGETKADGEEDRLQQGLCTLQLVDRHR